VKVENKKIGKGFWSVDVDGVNIKVENKASVAKLIVNDKIQDIYVGMIGSPRFTGKLPNGKEIKVVISGNWKVCCHIFVDCELVLEA
jgi:hypothetical protein